MLRPDPGVDDADDDVLTGQAGGPRAVLAVSPRKSGVVGLDRSDLIGHDEGDARALARSAQLCAPVRVAANPFAAYV